MIEVWRRALTTVRERRSVILGYHGVGVSPYAEDPFCLRVPPAAFRTHLDLLGGAGFEFVTVAQLARRAAGSAPPAGMAALSFDDGMRDNHATLLPILRERGLPATVYIVSGLVGKPNPWLSPTSAERMMTEVEIRELADAGVEIGAHTVTHPDLTTLDHDACLRELTGSRRDVERIVGIAPSTFAYPYCRYGETAVVAARAAGFAAAVTGEGRGSWSQFELKRAMVSGRDGLATFVLKLVDAYQPLFDSPPGRLGRVATRGVRRRLRARRERLV